MLKLRGPIVCLVTLGCGFASLISAAPAITSVQNAASNILPSVPNTLPNSGIAFGAIFVVKGSGLGPPDISIASKPFQATILSGTSVAITVGGRTVSGLMYYTSDKQIAALLPSNAPFGAGTVTVTYNGETSPPAPFNVAFRNLGIFTLDSSGQGPAIVTYPDYSLVSALKSNCGGPSTACGAANPGDTLILWGTGLGQVPGNDATGVGLGQNMPQINLTLWIGGIQAPILYQGRSGCCIGEDQIVFTVPDNVPTGCAVPLVGLISQNTTIIPSNSTVIPIAPKGSRDCTPNLQTGSVSLLQDALAGRPANFAEIDTTKPVVGLSINTRGTDMILAYSDRVDFIITRLLTPGMAPFLGSFVEDHSTGTCLTYYPASNTRHNLPLANVAGLDAGTSFSITGPNGNKSVSGNASGGFGETLDAAGAYLTPGGYRVSGTGGNDVGSFTANVTVPPKPQLTTPLLGTSINRADGYTVTWTGGTPGARLRILLGFPAATIECYASAVDGTFTIPANALYSIPPLLGGHRLLVNVVTSGTFTATGLNLGVINVSGPPDGRFPIDVP